MKPQDVAFIIVLVTLLFMRRPKWFVTAGILCLILSIPLFAFWVFFTAQRLVYYGAAFIFTAIIILMYQYRRKD